MLRSLCVLAGVVALVLWWLWSAEVLPAGLPADRAEPAAEPVVSPVGAERQELGVEAAILELQVQAAGEPVEAEVQVVQDADPKVLTATLAKALRDPASRRSRLVLTGHREIEVDAQQWTLLRMSRKGSAMVARQLRLAPFRGRLSRLVDLSAELRTVHVQLYRSDLSAVAVDAEVRLVWEPLGSDPRSKPQQQTARSDVAGCVSFSGLAPGLVQVLAPGAGTRDLPPYTARVILAPTTPLLETSCCLRVMPSRSQVSLQVFAEGVDRRARAKLFLRRVDLASADLLPQQGSLRQGVQSLMFEVPDGVYEVASLPLWQYRIEPSTIRVRGDTEASVEALRVESVPTTLTGLPRRAFPVRVFPDESSQLTSLDPQLMFVGESWWRSPVGAVPRRDAAVRLVALGRQLCFLSEAVVIAGAALEVAMLPATQINVVWAGPLPECETVVTFDSAGTQVARQSSPQLVSLDGILLPALCCAAAVPRGAVTVRGHGPDGVIWTRELVADRARLVLRVP